MPCDYCKTLAKSTLENKEKLAMWIKEEITKEGVQNQYLAACKILSSLGVSPDKRSFYIVEALQNSKQ